MCRVAGRMAATVARVATSILRATLSENTLIRFQYLSRFEAERGVNGQKSNRHGKNGGNKVITVPVGTLVRDADTGACSPT